MARRGRPRKFDRDEALQRAMEMFWAWGYEGTTVTDLQQAMGGIQAPSFYAAFGSKEALFRESVALYTSTEGAAMLEALMAEQRTAREAIEAFLLEAVASFCQADKPRGCMQVVGALNCMRENYTVQDHLRDLRRSRVAAIRKRLERGIEDADLRADVDLEVFACFYATVLDGLSLQARDGASREALSGTVAYAMSVWEKVV